jgi:hypothetical protein
VNSSSRNDLIIPTAKKSNAASPTRQPLNID